MIVTVTWGIEKQPIPNAESFVTYDIALTASDGTVVAKATEPLGVSTHAFADLTLAPGDYTASVGLVDANGNLAAPAATGTFNIPAPATADVPVSVTVAVS